MQKLTKKLPDAPGVYIFRGEKRPNARGARASAILYIGKATSLRTRVASYFRRDVIATRGPIIASMVETAKTVDTIITDSVLEALVLEAYLIKKHQPPYNTKEKDNKSFNYVVITKEEYPRVIIMRLRNLEVEPPSDIKYSFGPFPQGSVLREALSLVRKIFPFRDKCVPNSGKPCFNAQIGLCPGVCTGKVSRAEYAKTIHHIKLFFEGKKSTLLRSLEREMKHSARAFKFEEADRIKKTIFALKHIQDVALLKSEILPRASLGRIEAYDIAHISGTNAVGVMVVVEDGEVRKSEYRKFKLRTSTNDDVASLREVLTRRFEHTEWPLPKLIVVDGGKTQMNMVVRLMDEWGLAIPVVSVVKDEHHRPREILKNPRASLGFNERDILLANSEAHRFAIEYHRTLRGKIK